MQITVVGCGNFDSRLNYNQCFLLEEDGRTMIFDYGYKIPDAIDNLNINIQDIDDVYISHLHADHIGGLEPLGFTRYDWAHKPRHFSDSHVKVPRLIANKHLLDDLWNKSLCGGLDSMEGFDANINTFFEPKPIEPNIPFEWQGWECKLIQQVHIMTGSIISNTFGLLMSKEGHKTIYFTADSQHCSPRQMENFYTEADIIFQDCECIGVNYETKKLDFMSGVHANYAQLAGWPSANSVDIGDDIRQKMWLSHYQDFVMRDTDYLGHDVDWEKEAEFDNFKGFVKVGQVIEV